jgi:hypothetical protein
MTWVDITLGKLSGKNAGLQVRIIHPTAKNITGRRLRISLLGKHGIISLY